MDKIKVLHVTSTPRGIGGVERLLLDMARHYDLTRFSVAHCNLFDQAGGAGLFPTALRATGLPYFQIDGHRWYDLPKILRDLSSLIRRENFDVVHLHMVHATILGGLVGRSSPRSHVVVTKHYTYDLVDSVGPRLLDRLFTNRADAVAAVSHHVARDLLGHGAPEAKITVIHNGTDLDSFDRRAAEPLHQLGSRRGLLIGCLGSLHPRKGHQYLIRAMPHVLVEFPNVHLVVWGEGSERKRLEQLSSRLNAEHAVTFAGFAANVPAALRQIHLFVHPSVGEAFGIAILEAMAAGKAVVATDVQGIPEIVAHGVTGLLVPPDPIAIAQALCRLLKNAHEREKMGRAARVRVAQQFDIRKTVRSYEQLYEAIAGSTRVDGREEGRGSRLPGRGSPH